MSDILQPMLLDDRIKQALADMIGNQQLSKLCGKLNEDFQAIVEAADRHLSQIAAQMPDYDDHSSAHSLSVQARIEALMGPESIGKLTFLEAELLKLCCHFHDTGMAVPEWCLSLMKKTEAENFCWHRSRDELRRAIEDPTSGWAPEKRFEEVKDLFLIPATNALFVNMLVSEIWSYEEFRQGLEPWNKEDDRDKWLTGTREEYLRRSHAQRSGCYAQGLSKLFKSFEAHTAEKNKLSEAVGQICQGHTESLKKVNELPILLQVRPGVTDPALCCNPRYLALLLRLGDVLDLHEGRASLTLYWEHNPMNSVSEKHWTVKNLTGLTVEIKDTPAPETKQINCMGSFSDPELYYFLQNYLNWADEELHGYGAFVEDMKQMPGQEDRFDHRLPERVDRTGLSPVGFTPDPELKLTMEQGRVIELLMGTRLYTDDFTCLRELYQNALDASRCMRAINLSKTTPNPQELPIVFGLEKDEEGRTFLYCRDQGIGMTRETVLHYLLRVGNSYYRSEEFRRENSLWKNDVAPISEFGIGLLSCFIIGDRIEVITRHYTGGSPLWVHLDSIKAMGYFRYLPQHLLDRLGDHGTEVRVYLKGIYQDQDSLNDWLPENSEQALNVLYLSDNYHSPSDSISLERSSLWFRLQKTICVPEPNYSVHVRSINGKEHKLISTQNCYPLDAIKHFAAQYNSGLLSWLNAIANFVLTPCRFTDMETGSEVQIWLWFPKTASPDYTPVSWYTPAIGPHFCIDGLSVANHPPHQNPFDNVFWNWKKSARPVLDISREKIQSYPPEYSEAGKRLSDGLLAKIAEAVEAHFKLFPDSNNPSARSALLRYIYSKLQPRTGNYAVLWRNLASGSFFEHVEDGLPMKTFLGEDSAFYLPSPSLLCDASNPISDIALPVLFGAQSISLEHEQVFITTGTPVYELPIERNNVFRLINWHYNQDIRGDLFPFVSPDLFDGTDCNTVSTKTGKATINPYYQFYMRIDPLRLSSYSRYDSSKTNQLMDLISNGYAITVDYDPAPSNTLIHGTLITAFSPPRKLSIDEQSTFSLHLNFAQVKEGLKNGWSSLFFPVRPDNASYYGMILMPGEVDRASLAALIPISFRDAFRAKGVTFKFTDGTPAFPDEEPVSPDKTSVVSVEHRLKPRRE